MTHQFQGGDSRFPPLKGLGDSLHDLLCTELRQQRDRGGEPWEGAVPWEDPMTRGGFFFLWCRGLGLPVYSSGCFGRMIEGENAVFF